MILDSSVIIAVIADETPRIQVEKKIATVGACRVGAPTLVETGMVLTGRLGSIGWLLLSHLLQVRLVDVLSFSDAHWRIAHDAFVRYGKGRHPAKLNFGDCLTYAVAHVADEPLLCIGDSFAQTDLKLVDLEAE